MITVVVPEKYENALGALGDIQSGIEQALQRYTVEQAAEKITKLRRQAQGFETKYGMDYATFMQRIAQDETFLKMVESSINPLWELDLAEWEFSVKGIEDWTHTLEAVLLT